jgi:hypothetical protein
MCSAEPAIPLEPAASSKEAATKARQMEMKRKQAESSAGYRAKVKDAGGKDAWALQQAQCAEAAAELLNQ